MPRYIDADALKQRIMNNWYTASEISDDIDAEPTADVVEKERYDRLLENATIISDALNKYQTADEVKVVRCKDCVHWGSTISQADREQCASEGVDLVCAYWESDGLYADDFCSYGERKETEDGSLHRCG